MNIVLYIVTNILQDLASNKQKHDVVCNKRLQEVVCNQQSIAVTLLCTGSGTLIYNILSEQTRV